jgi:hypothetical protein
MKEQERRDNLLGAFVLSVSDRLRRETEESIGHTGASAAALITIAQYPGRSIEFLRQAISPTPPPSGWSTASSSKGSSGGARGAADRRWR